MRGFCAFLTTNNMRVIFGLLVRQNNTLSSEKLWKACLTNQLTDYLKSTTKFIDKKNIAEALLYYFTAAFVSVVIVYLFLCLKTHFECQNHWCWKPFINNTKGLIRLTFVTCLLTLKCLWIYHLQIWFSGVLWYTSIVKINYISLIVNSR